jgi:hypothetical protein
MMMVVVTIHFLHPNKDGLTITAPTTPSLHLRLQRVVGRDRKKKKGDPDEEGSARSFQQRERAIVTNEESDRK